MRRDSKLVVYYVNGEKVNLSHSSVCIGKTEHQMIGNAHKELAILTRDHRLQIMIDQIGRDGYAERDSVRFAADGTITKGRTTIDINRMYEQGEVGKGRKFESFSTQLRSSNPYTRGFGENGLGLFKKKITYDSCTDADIVDAVVEYLHNKHRCSVARDDDRSAE